MGQRIVGQRDPVLWSCLPLLGCLLVGAVLVSLVAWLNWPR